jgi:tRNA (guanine-N(7)-)-methyltransferase subunit TRM82
LNCVLFDKDATSILIADKSGDVFQFIIESEEKEGKCILGHLSMLLDIKLSKCGKSIITCDRDEKIRVSHFPNAYNIHNFCVGHSDFVTCLDMFNDGKATNDKFKPYPPS